MSKDTTEVYDVVPVFAVDESGKALITEEQYSWLCNYAVRKAERVQELEDVNGQLGYLLGKVYGESNFEINDLIKQNKRYREAIKEAGNELFLRNAMEEEEDATITHALEILNKALEESE